MTAPPRRAKVDDVIEHGQDIPANVVEMTGDDGDPWRRGPDGWTCRNRYDGMPYKALTDVGTSRVLEYAPLTVVEVDPEPQPADEIEQCDECEGNGVNCHPHRVVDVDLTPEQQCAREDAHGGHRWRNGDLRWRWCDGYVGRAAVPVDPEPRTWSHIGDGSVEGGHLPEVVRVDRTGGDVEIWAQVRGLRGYRRDADTPALSLLELRTLGEVTEVLGDA